MLRFIVSLSIALSLIASEANAGRRGGCSSGNCNNSATIQQQSSNVPQLAPLVVSPPQVNSSSATAIVTQGAVQTQGIAVAPLATVPLYSLQPMTQTVQGYALQTQVVPTTQTVTTLQAIPTTGVAALQGSSFAQFAPVQAQGVIVPLAVQSRERGRIFPIFGHRGQTTTTTAVAKTTTTTKPARRGGNW